MNARDLRGAVYGEYERLVRLKSLLAIMAAGCADRDVEVNGRVENLGAALEHITGAIDASATRLWELAREPEPATPRDRPRKRKPALSVVPSTAA